MPRARRRVDDVGHQASAALTSIERDRHAGFEGDRMSKFTRRARRRSPKPQSPWTRCAPLALPRASTVAPLRRASVCPSPWPRSLVLLEPFPRWTAAHASVRNVRQRNAWTEATKIRTTDVTHVVPVAVRPVVAFASATPQVGSKSRPVAGDVHSFERAHMRSRALRTLARLPVFIPCTPIALGAQASHLITASTRHADCSPHRGAALHNFASKATHVRLLSSRRFTGVRVKTGQRFSAPTTCTIFEQRSRMPAMNLLQAIAVTVSGLVGTLVAVLFTFQENLIYHPSLPAREYAEDPSDHAMPYEDVEIVADDGVRIHAWLIRRQDSASAPTFVYFHGNTYPAPYSPPLHPSTACLLLHTGIVASVLT